MNQFDLLTTASGELTKEEEANSRRDFPETGNKYWKGNGTGLVFNISPRFLHLNFYNINHSRSYNYVYCTSKFVKGKNRHVRTRCCSNHGLKATMMNSLGEQTIFRVNIFKDDCACGNCVAKTYVLEGKQPFQLRNELLQVLNSELCRNWNRNWLKSLMEQLLLVLACIKDGVICERLIETACGVGMLLVKPVGTDLLENRYSYFSFHELFWRLNGSYWHSKRINCKRKREDLKIYCGKGIGSVYFDVIDNFTILSFETEKELSNYTEYERKMHMKNPESLMRLFKNSYKRSKTDIRSNDCSEATVVVQKKEDSTVKSACAHQKTQENKIYLVNKDNCKEVEVLSNTDHTYHTEMKTDKVQCLLVKDLENCSTSSLLNVQELEVEKRLQINSTEEETSRRTSSEADQCNMAASVRGLDKIPIFHQCSLRNNGPCNCKWFSLGMTLLVGHQRPLSRFAVDNLVSLSGNDHRVSHRMANIAASALCVGDSVKKKVIVVPVVVRSIVEAVKVNCKPVRDPIEETMAPLEVNSTSPSNVNNSPPQKRIVRELTRLNASLVGQDILKETHHRDGCDARNCNGDCDESKGSTKQLIRTANGNTVSIADLNNRSKREVKLSRKFRESWSLDAWKFREEKAVPQEHVRQTFHHRRRVAIMQKCKHSRRPGYRTLDDFHIWCAMHHKYSCQCHGVICRLVDNLVLWIPPKYRKNVSARALAAIKLNEDGEHEFRLYNTDKYCARSYGAPLMYLIRNRTEVFQVKRRYELERRVISLTNSYIKIKTPELIPADRLITSSPPPVHRRSLDNVLITAQDEDIIVDCESVIPSINELAVIPVKKLTISDDIIVVSDSDDEVTGDVGVVKETDLTAPSCSFVKETVKSTVEAPASSPKPQSQVVNYTKSKRDPMCKYIIQQKFDPSLEYCLMKLEDHPLKQQMYCEDRLPKLALYCLTPGIGYLPIVEYDQTKLVVQDPVFPELLHSFKSLNAANIWMNKFLKDFLVFESIELALKWVIVKPGIIKMKQSLPFSPAILESSSLIITKKGELLFSKNQYRHYDTRKLDTIHKRKTTEDATNDVDPLTPPAEGFRKRLHTNNNSPVTKSKITVSNSFSSILINRRGTSHEDSPGENSEVKKQKLTTAVELQNKPDFNSNTLVSVNHAIDGVTKFNANMIKHYKVIPANLIIPVNIPANLLRDNNLTLKRI